MGDTRPHPGNRFEISQPFIGRPLRNVWAHFERELLSGLAVIYGSDLTTASNRVMLLIDLDGTTISELARRAGIAKQSMAEAIAILESKGLVTRVPDPDDGRAKRVTLTRDGKRALAAGRDVAQAINDRWTNLLGEREMARLQALLGRLSSKLDENAVDLDDVS